MESNFYNVAGLKCFIGQLILPAYYLQAANEEFEKKTKLEPIQVPKDVIKINPFILV